MRIDLSLESYDYILREILKWRAVPLGLLHDLSGYQGTKKSFYRVIKNLESKKLIKSAHYNGLAKIIYPSSELATLTKVQAILFQEESLSHEAMVTLVCCELMTWEIFISNKLPHEITQGKYDSGIRRLPDATFDGINKGKAFKLALEMEVSRKSKTRVQNKIEDYLSNNVFDFVFYIFNDRFIYEGYKRILEDYLNQPQHIHRKNESSAKFILGFKKDIISTKFKLEQLEIYYQGKITTLDKILGKRRGISA